MGEQLQRPENFAGLRESILHRRDTLPKRLAQVADYFVHNPDDVAFGTTSSIAAMAEVQPSTLVRFAQALGYSGFTDLQTIFRDRLRKQVPDYRVRLAAIRSRTGDSRHAVVFRGIFEAARRSLENAEELRDPALLESAVTTLSRADTIYLIGRRRAFPVVSAVAYTLGKLGVRSLLVSSANGTEPSLYLESYPFKIIANRLFFVSFW